MANFNQALKKTLVFEGGYVNDPDDPGGETNFGISKRSYPDLDIKNITDEQVRDIYRSDYWNKTGCSDLRDQDLADTVFDFAVNAGVKRASKYLQIAANALDKSPFTPLRIDGIIGLYTLGRVKTIEPKAITAFYNTLRLRFYRRLARNTTRRKYLYSWIRRITD